MYYHLHWSYLQQSTSPAIAYPRYWYIDVYNGQGDLKHVSHNNCKDYYWSFPAKQSSFWQPVWQPSMIYKCIYMQNAIQPRGFDVFFYVINKTMSFFFGHRVHIASPWYIHCEQRKLQSGVYGWFGRCLNKKIYYDLNILAMFESLILQRYFNMVLRC